MKKNTMNELEPTSRSSNTTSTDDNPTALDYLLILDFEATCDNVKRPNPQEIIEFPTLLYNVQTRAVEDIFHFYIKPVAYPQLSQFCKNLTGITQEQITNDGIPLKDALYRHELWLHEKGLVASSLHDNIETNETGCESYVKEDQRSNHRTAQKTFVYLTCGDWDLKTCLPRQLEYNNEKVPSHFKTWINIKKEFTKLYGTKGRGMVETLEKLGLELEGRHHSGIDDCHNIAKICTKMLQDGWKPRIV